LEKALILAEGLFSTTDGKTAHGLVRYSRRYEIVGVIDSTLAGVDAGEVLDGKPRGIKIFESLRQALSAHPDVGTLVVGVATPGGKLPDGYREVIKEALTVGLNVVSGLHEFLSDDPELASLAKRSGAAILDVRKRFRDMRVFYTGKIREVKALKVVVLGTDSCVGKRTTAIMLSEELNRRGVKSVVVGTGQTAWLQGIEYGIVLDAMVNDFITGGLEHEIVRAYENERPDVIVVPAQGGLIHPVFPGGYEVLSLVDPEVVILQHAPARKHLDGYPEAKMPPVSRYIRLLKLMTKEGVSAIVINTERMSAEDVRRTVEDYERRFGVIACAPLQEGIGKLADFVASRIRMETVEKRQ
jgi:uncharacterized NAD-dependent epimerase/dehydratase family protein